MRNCMSERTEKLTHIIIDEMSYNLEKVVNSSNRAKDMIVRSLKTGDKNKKYSVDEVIEFLEDSFFKIEMKGDNKCDLILNIPEKEKK